MLVTIISTTCSIPGKSGPSQKVDLPLQDSMKTSERQQGWTRIPRQEPILTRAITLVLLRIFMLRNQPMAMMQTWHQAHILQSVVLSHGLTW